MFNRLASVLTLVTTAALALAQPTRQAPAHLPASPDPLPLSGLARGVNFGNMLEGPFEGAWGLTVEERFFDIARDAGMDHIRLPVSWTHHTQDQPPYAINAAFLDRVQWCVDQALARGLKIIVNTHHYDELNADPIAEAPRALAIWQQVASRFASYPDTVYFEVLNEPHAAFNDTPQLWNDYLAQALATIRQTNPARPVLVGPVRWNSIAALDTFDPPADPNLILAVHYYDPFNFTHQGASWVNPSPPVGTTWTGTPISLAPGYDNWSWNTTVTTAPTGLSIDYQQGWAGLYLRRGSRLEGVRRIAFTTDRALTLNVIAGNDDTDQGFPVTTTPNVETVVTLPQAFVPVERIMLQNATPSDQPPFTLSNIRVETNTTIEPVLVTERQSIDRALKHAADWARARNMPVHLGEFGAYSPADMDSRARWTRAVRRSAERHGLSWAYWELAAGFGFFDPQAGVYRQPLVDALTR
jgi:endoglucanase